MLSSAALFASLITALLALSVSADSAVAAARTADRFTASALTAEDSRDRILIAYADGASAHARRAALAGVDGETVVERIGALDVAVLEVAPGISRRDVLQDLRADAAISAAEPDVPMRASHADCRSNVACSVPNDPIFPYQWGLENDPATRHFSSSFNLGADIAAPLAWARSLGDASTRVAVLDTGVDVTHPDLAGRFVLSATAFPDDGSDLNGHGTHVAGVIGANRNNHTGIAGLAPLATMLNVKTLDDTGATSCAIAADAVAYAVDQGADVINASFGSSRYCSTLEAAVNYAVSRDVLVIAAAGNGASSAREYPGALSNVIGVAATTNTDERASFSSFGADWVDVAAPGQDIVSTVPGGYAVVSGTSQAAPYVSGVAALIWASVRDANGNGRRNDDVARRLLNYADPIAGTGTLWANGRLNACQALAGDTSVCSAPAVLAPVITPTPDASPVPVTPPVPVAPSAPVTPAPTPVATPRPVAAPTPTPPALSSASARRAATRALSRRYKTAWGRGRAKHISCLALKRPHMSRCRVSWRHGRYRYTGAVHVEARVDKVPRAWVAVRRRPLA